MCYIHYDEHRDDVKKVQAAQAEKRRVLLSFYDDSTRIKWISDATIRDGIATVTFGVRVPARVFRISACSDESSVLDFDLERSIPVDMQRKLIEAAWHPATEVQWISPLETVGVWKHFVIQICTPSRQIF
jgi:hypothetical protein